MLKCMIFDCFCRAGCVDNTSARIHIAHIYTRSRTSASACARVSSRASTRPHARARARIDSRTVYEYLYLKQPSTSGVFDLGRVETSLTVVVAPHSC